MSQQPQANRSSNSRSRNGPDGGAHHHQDSGQFGPNTFHGAGAQVWLRPEEVDAYGRGLHATASSTGRRQIHGPTSIPPQIPSNAGVHHAYAHQGGHSPQYHPQLPYQVAHAHGPHPGPSQHSTLHHRPQDFHLLQLQPQPHVPPPPPQPALATGGSRAPRASAEGHSWDRLCHYRTQWNPNAVEPRRNDGESVLMNFALRAEGTIRCRVPMSNGFCGYTNVKKERLLHHIRKEHLSFLPFPCGGGCPTQNCQLRFACETSRNDHRHPRKTQCHSCGKEMHSQNLATHRASCNKRPPS